MFRFKTFLSGLLLSGAALLPTVSHAQDAANQKLALVVGISDYQHGGAAKAGWWNLHAQNDAMALRQVLQERFGFAAQDIQTLSDAQATRQNIVQAFETQLIARAKPGDIVVFHFSGHGQRVPDDNGDEADGMDESLVPYDAISQKASEGAKTNLRDDQLDDLLGRLRQKMLGPDGKLKGNITVSIDAGFAGEAMPNQNGLLQRGRGWNAELDGTKPAAAPNGKVDSASGLFAQGEAQVQGYVVLAAAGNEQAAHEIVNEAGENMGALSSYWTRALASSTPDTTYRAVVERLAVEVGGALSAQVPQLEGDVDKVLLAGAALPLPPYLVVQSVDNNVVTLPVGTLQGATALSRYALYKAGSDVTKAENRIAQVELTEVGLTSSRARLVKDEAANAPQVLAGDLKAARAIESEHNYGDSSLKVRVETPGDWANTLKDLPMVSLADDKARYDLLLRSADGKIVVQRPDGTTFTQIVDDATAPAKLQKFLNDYWRWQFLLQLHNDDPKAALNVALRLVPVKVKLNAKGQIDSVVSDREDVEITDGNRLVLRDGDSVVLELRNNSAEDAYVTVLDLPPDGSINPIFPHPQAPHDNKIVADKQWHRLPMPFVFTMGPPYGNEVFKAIATREPADFSSLLQGQTVQQSRGAPKNPLGGLLLSSSTGQRGANFADIAPSDWSTSNATFEVRPVN